MAGKLTIYLHLPQRMKLNDTAAAGDLVLKVGVSPFLQKLVATMVRRQLTLF